MSSSIITPLDYINKLGATNTSGLKTYEEYKAEMQKPTEDMCVACRAEYKKFNDEMRRNTSGKWIDVYPECSGSLDKLEMSESEWSNMGGSPEEYEMLLIERDPLKWAAAELGFITSGMSHDRDGDLISMDRWYEERMIRCSAKFKLYRMGRRLGKTVSMRIETLKDLCTISDFNVILVAPFETQLIKFEEGLMDLINKSTSLRDVLKKQNKTKHTISFGNGSHYEGYCTGGDKQSKTADRVRGAGANKLVLDEADYISEDALQAVLAVMSDDPKCKVLLASTPSGKRSFFYDWATKKDIGFKEWHFYSHASPSYTKQADNLYRSTLSSDKYTKEYLGGFGTLIEALIKPTDINRATEVYDMGQLRTAGPKPGCTYVVGVDWNGRKIGTVILVLEWDGRRGKYRMVDKIVVKDQEYNYETSCKAAMNAFKHWHAKYMYVDAGHGDMQIEMMKKTAMLNKDMRLAKGIIGVPMQGYQIIRDPLTGAEVKKFNKEFAINLMVNTFERGGIEIPYSENYKEGEEDWGVIPQLYDLAVEKITGTGRTTYQKTVDHGVTPLYLALLGFHMKMTDIGQPSHDDVVQVVTQGDLKHLPGNITISGIQAREKQKQKDKKALAPDEYMPRSAKMSPGALAGPSYGNQPTVVASSVEWVNGIPKYKHDNKIIGVKTHNLGMIQRKTF